MNYLQELKRAKPRIFIVIVFFMTMQCLVTLAKVETTPFFIFGMFSDIFHPVPIYEGIQIKINGRFYNYMQLSDVNKEFMLSPIWQYYNMSTNDNENPSVIKIRKRLPAALTRNRISKNLLFETSNNKTDMQKFPDWLERYLGKVTEEKINHVEVFINNYEYKNYNLVLVSSNKIIDGK